MKSKKRLVLSVIAILFVVYVLLGFNPMLEITSYTYKNSKIPDAFQDYKIVLISDLHHENFGSNQSALISAVAEQSPDIVVMTGDIVDEDHTDLKPIEDLLKGISDLCPIYYISGNHDVSSTTVVQYSALQTLFEKYGVYDIDDSQVVLQKGDDEILLTGQEWRSIYVADYLEPADPSYFNILLYHGSDCFDLISPFGYDLVLSGHTHGGLIRLPFVGGLITNTGAIFPKYAGGAYTQGVSTLISSRGLGDAALPRFYNRPELVVITLVNQ